MSKISIYPRIISTESEIEAAPPAVSSRTGFDYAALVKKSRQARARQHPQPNTVRARAPAQPDTPALREAPDEFPSPYDFDEDDESEAGFNFTPQTLTPTVAETPATPYVDLLAGQQLRVARLIQFLADRVTDFACDEAIRAHGNWSIRIPLDPALLRACTLYLTLSHFDLQLRFETSDDVTKHLISSNSEILKNHLDELLAKHDAPRDVEIIV